MRLLRTNLLVALVAVAIVTAGLRWAPAADPAPAGPQPPAAEKVIYTCPMHPKVVSDKPGTCPTCQMALKSKKVAATPPAKAAASVPSDAIASDAPPAPDHADMKMEGAGTGMGGMGMGAGIGSCPMGACPMAMGAMPSPPGKAAIVMTGVPSSRGGGGCGCR